jgi:hypothetical protein
MRVSRLFALGSAILLTAAAAGVSVGVLRSALAVEPPKVEKPPSALVEAPDPPKDQNGDDPEDNLLSVNHLKQLGLAMHVYHDAYGHFPPAAVLGKDGKPLISWRVLVLPYVAERKLFKQFKLDEPWDSTHNKALLPQMPAVFRSKRPKPGMPFETYFQVFTGRRTMFDRAEGRSLGEITDGTSNTIMIAEGTELVPWTKPAELVYDPTRPVPRLGGPFQRGFHATFADGSVRLYRKQWNEAHEKTMHLLIQRDDGNPIMYEDPFFTDPLPGKR